LREIAARVANYRAQERGLLWGRKMEKVIWSDHSLDHTYHCREAGSLDAARGLVIGLAISQVFWVALALFLF
jgi:hypothetical protein